MVFEYGGDTARPDRKELFIMGALSPTHWLIIIGVVVVLFGAKKLPEAARGLGRSTRILKAELNGLHHDDPAPAANNDGSAMIGSQQHSNTNATRTEAAGSTEHPTSTPSASSADSSASSAGGAAVTAPQHDG